MYRILAKTKKDVLVSIGTFGVGSVLYLWDILCRFRFVPIHVWKGKHKKMELNITKLANLEGSKAEEFLTKIDSKLMMDIKKSQINLTPSS